jgi:hypothetical protein
MRTLRGLALVAAILVTWLSASGPLAAISQDLGWGHTHATWEQPALKSAVRFADATVTAVRRPNGAVEATLTSNDGAILARLDLAPGADNLRLRTRQEGEVDWFSSTEVAYSAAEAPVLDWVNLQLYSWWKDVQDMRTKSTLGQAPRLTSDGSVSGQDFFHPVQSDRPKVQADETAKSLAAAELEFTGEYARSERTPTGFATYLWKKSARNVRGQSPWNGVAARPAAAGDTLLGFLLWQEDRQILTFSVGADQLKKQQLSELHAEDLPLGYFPFQPTMPWANVQIRQLWGGAADGPASISDSFTSISAPDTPGCTGLSWLDNSSLRPCCDQHDLCYRANSMYTGANCNASSWFWPYCASTPGCGWSCEVCNIQVVFCFAVNLMLHGPRTPVEIPFGPWWSWGPDPPICHTSYPGYCPAECMWCT